MRLIPDLQPGERLTARWWARVLAGNAVIVALVFAGIQLIPITRENPPILREPEWDSLETRELTVQACYDCHSNYTRWPWYASVAPVSWVVWYDVTEGREALNFTEWDRHVDDNRVDPDDPFPPKTLNEKIEEEIRSGRMPPRTYRLLHPEARLSDAEQDALIDGLLRSIEQTEQMDAGEQENTAP